MFEWFEKFFERVPLEGAGEVDGDETAGELVELDEIEPEKKRLVRRMHAEEPEVDQLAREAHARALATARAYPGPVPKADPHPRDVPDVYDVHLEEEEEEKEEEEPAIVKTIEMAGEDETAA